MNNNSLFDKIKKGVGATVVEQLLNTTVQLVQVPIFLMSWGKVIYGEWLLIYTIPSLLSISDFGFSKAAINLMTLYYSKEDIDSFKKIFYNIRILNTLIALCLFLIIFISIQIFEEKTLFDSKSLSHLNGTKLMIICLVLYGLLNLQNALYFGVFFSTGKFSTSIYLNVILKLLEFLITIFLLYVLESAPRDIAIFLCLFAIVKTFFLIIYTKRKFVWLKVQHSLISKTIILDLAKPALGFMLFPLGNAIKLQLPITLIGMYLGPSSIVLFNTTRTLLNFISQILHIILRPFTPEITVAFGLNNIYSLRKLHIKISAFAIVTSFLLCMLLFFLFDTILQFWLNGKVEPDSGMLWILLISQFVGTISLVSSYFLYSFNKHFSISIIFLILTTGGLLITIPFIKMYGLIVICLGLCFIELTYSLFVFIKVVKLLGQGFFESMKEVFYDIIGLPSFILSIISNR